MIKLDLNFSFEPESYPILPDNAPQIGELQRIIGWGSTREYGEPSNILKFANVPVFDPIICKKRIDMFNETCQYCAGYEEGGVDACQGDSGGPIFQINGQDIAQYGIVSYGTGCAREGFPGVYTSVASLKSWILDQMRK